MLRKSASIGTYIQSNLRLDIILVILFNILTYLWFTKVDALEWLYFYSLTHEDIELDEFIVLFFTLSISIGIFAIRRWQEGKALLNHIHTLAIVDPLTDAFNRRYMDNMLMNEVQRASRSSDKFSVLLLDIDYFKKVNDNFGHDSGDKILIQFSKLLREHTRTIDTVARWGGEEFLILCPDTDMHGAENVGQKLLKLIQQYEFHAVNHITASIGIATFHTNESITALINRADTCLYHAKDSGRNRVVSDT